jgi:hypothetical protein
LIDTVSSTTKRPATCRILADCEDLVQKHGLDRATTRLAIQAMLDEQPAPLRIS